jgi:hypothetical protein
MRMLDEIEGFVSGKLHRIKSLASLVVLEAKLAGLSLIHLISGVVLLFVILISTWSLLLVLIGYGVYLLYPSIGLAITSPLLLNIISVAVIALYLKSNAQQMTFAKSRKFLFSKEPTENELKEAVSARDSHSRKGIVDTTNP